MVDPTGLGSVPNELWSLTEAMCDGTISVEEKDRLESLLRSSESSRLFYAAYMDLHARMLWRFRGSGYGLPRSVDEAESQALARRGGSPASRSWRPRKTVIAGLGITLLTSAAVLLVVYLVQHALFGDRLPPGAVAKVTGTVDCYWAEGAQPVALHDPIAPGRQIDLEEGMLKITYRSGGHVILQGPVSYRVESDKSGFLSMGKLTGKVTTSDARGFTVRTVNATVVDLGTEFGVEVASDGAVETQVFTGKVKLAAATSPDQTPSEIVLNPGQAAQVVHKPGDDPAGAAAAGLMIQVVSAAGTDRFVRTMPPARADILISPTRCNGSFETPAVGSDSPAAETGKDPAGMHAKNGGAVPRYWNPTASLQTKGKDIRDVTGNQYVVLREPRPVLSTQFDGKPGHPATRTYDANTTYVLTADIGANQSGVEGVVGFAFEGATRKHEQTVRMTEPGVMKPMPALKLNTSEHPEFVGKLVTLSFLKTKGSQLYIDNVMLKALPSAADKP